MVESTVNNCHYESVTAIVRMPLYREIQGLCFYVWFVGKIMDLTGGTFAPYLYITQIHVFSIGQETMAVQKKLTDQWDQAKATKRTSSF